VIRGYTALIDPESVGRPLAAMMAITPLDPAHEYDIPERAEASICRLKGGKVPTAGRDLRVANVESEPYRDHK
jgi:hypothetical protein